VKTSETYIHRLMYWEHIVHDISNTWEIKPVVLYLLVPRIRFESKLYTITLTALADFSVHTEEPECIQDRPVLEGLLSTPCFICNYCNIVCYGNNIVDYRAHNCQESKYKSIKINETRWDYGSIILRQMDYSFDYFRNPGKH
jgi:hypothetical protein